MSSTDLLAAILLLSLSHWLAFQLGSNLTLKLILMRIRSDNIVFLDEADEDPDLTDSAMGNDSDTIVQEVKR